MNNKFEEKNIRLDKLLLDDNNPRFAELYQGDSQEDIIKYLLDEEDAKDISESILNMGFFRPEKKLLVLKDGSNYLVKDGNRRCAASKALQNPDKYDLARGIEIKELPVVIYDNESTINYISKEEHTSSLSKQWSPIAKALEVHRLYGKVSEENLKEIDSNIGRFMKISNFYFECVKIKGDDFKKLLRGKKSKLTMFERLWQQSDKCGFKFRDKKSGWSIDIFDKVKFRKFLFAMVDYIEANPEVSYYDVNKTSQQDIFFKKLEKYGFDIDAITTAEELSKEEKDEQTQSSSLNIASNIDEKSSDKSESSDVKGSTNNVSKKTNRSKKIRVDKRTSSLFVNLDIKRKNIPNELKKLFEESKRITFDADSLLGFPNASIALLRMIFEATLSYILKDTYFNNSSLDSRNCFKQEAKLSIKKSKFTEIVKSSILRRKFSLLDIEYANVIIHSNWTPTNEEIRNYSSRCEELINFMLQKQEDFENELDFSKL